MSLLSALLSSSAHKRCITVAPPSTRKNGRQVVLPWPCNRSPTPLPQRLQIENGPRMAHFQFPIRPSWRMRIPRARLYNFYNAGDAENLSRILSHPAHSRSASNVYHLATPGNTSHTPRLARKHMAVRSATKNMRWKMSLLTSPCQKW